MSWLTKINRTFVRVTKTVHHTFTHWGWIIINLYEIKVKDFRFSTASWEAVAKDFFNLFMKIIFMKSCEIQLPTLAQKASETSLRKLQLKGRNFSIYQVKSNSEHSQVNLCWDSEILCRSVEGFLGIISRSWLKHFYIVDLTTRTAMIRCVGWNHLLVAFQARVKDQWSLSLPRKI